MLGSIEMRIERLKTWLLDRLLTKEEKKILALKRAGYKPYATDTVSTQVVLSEKSHDYLATAQGKAKYDVVYGLTRQLADSLKPYVMYSEAYDPKNNEWICRIDLKVVK